MKRIEVKIPVRDLVDGYRKGTAEAEDVVGYHGQLIIRPRYQREFVYRDERRERVIDSICRNFPINPMYFRKVSDDRFSNSDKYELLDGQQRLLSICTFVSGDFSLPSPSRSDLVFWDVWPLEDREKIFNYEVTVYIAEGEEEEISEMFQRVNTQGGLALNDQELLNALYSGRFVDDAKKIFVRDAEKLLYGFDDYIQFPKDTVSEKSIKRQGFLRRVIEWKVGKNKRDILDFMANNKNNTADDLLNYFRDVRNWVLRNFNQPRKEVMKYVEWGVLYNKYKDKQLDPQWANQRITELLSDSDVQSKGNIINYLFSGEENILQLRTFDQVDKSIRHRLWVKQDKKCGRCGKELTYDEARADHIKPWSEGGKTEESNCRVLCQTCNAIKSNKF